MSDHQPVSADFDISVRTCGVGLVSSGVLIEGDWFVSCPQLTLIDRMQHENVVSALHRELGAFEGYGRRPKVKIQPTSIDFGAVK